MMMTEAQNQPELFAALAGPLIRKVGYGSSMSSVVETREIGRFNDDNYLWKPGIACIPDCEEIVPIFDSERISNRSTNGTP